MSRSMTNAALALIAMLAMTIVAGPVVAQFYTPKMLEEQREKEEKLRKAQQERDKLMEKQKAAEAAEQKRKDDAERAIQQEIQRARAGKGTVLGFNNAKVGLQTMMTVRVFQDGAERLLVIPNVQTKEGPWQVDDQLVAQLRRLMGGDYEVVHSETLLGMEFVVGVGADSPKTLQAWAAARAQKLAIFESTDARGSRTSRPISTSTDTATTTGEDAAASADTGGVAVGRFVRIIDETIDRRAYKVMIVERGMQMIQTQFWLAESSGRTMRPAGRELLARADALTEGQSVRITYETVDGRHLVKSFIVE